MKIKDLKTIFHVSNNNLEVLIRSEVSSIDGLRYNNWESFVNDSNNNDLLLDDRGYCILVGEHVVCVWVL